MSFTVIIEGKSKNKQYFKEIWNARELLIFFGWRDVLVRYKQTLIGIIWAVINPLVTMAIFTFLFGNIAKFPSNGVPYPLIVLSAMIPWNLFAGITKDAGNCLVSNSNLLSKVYFPRMIIPISTIVVNMVDAAISVILLLIFMLIYGCVPSIRIVLLLPLLLLMSFLSLGIGLFISAVNVKYRDVKFLIPFLLQALLYISPVGYISSNIPSKYSFLYALNPVVGIIDYIRWCIFPSIENIEPIKIVLSIIECTIFVIFGIRYFRKSERTFADIV
jgi:lipopolysaccharide transport system permease protein